MPSPQQSFQAFLAEAESSARFPNVKISPPEHRGNIATISGEVSSRQDHDDIVEMARQHGFHLFAQQLFIPCQDED